MAGMGLRNGKIRSSLLSKMLIGGREGEDNARGRQGNKTSGQKCLPLTCALRYLLSVIYFQTSLVILYRSLLL